MAAAAEPINVFWFRRDLRLHDNHGLFQAMQSSLPVLPLFIFDTDILGKLHNKVDKRVSFIHQTLRDLNEPLRARGNSLLVLHGTVLAAFETLTSRYTVKHVFTNHDYEPQAIARDEAVKKFLAQRQIGFSTFKDQVIFEKNEVMKADGKPYTVFTPYSRIWKQQYASVIAQNYPSQNHLEKFIETDALEFPTLAQLGFEDKGCDIQPLQISADLIRNYESVRNFPALSGTSHAGIHLRFGTVSVRQLARLAKQTSETWLNELIWREFFMMILYQFPYVVNASFKKVYDQIPWLNNEDHFEAWCKGETGYPMVDAGMRQLNETGWMHNRVRMVTASFLTKHLLIDWRWGEAYFAEKLLDYELSSNNGNWQWAAGCGCDAAPYFRIFNPTEQARKFDPEQRYIKTWIKNLTTNYPLPIVEHEKARKRALETYKKGLETVSGE